MAALAVACNGGGADLTATSTTEGTSTPAGNTQVQNPTVTTDTPTGDVTPSTGLSPLEIVQAQEQVLKELFESTVDSVVKIQTISGIGGGEGSGWLWDDQGHIVTNYHVVEGAESIDVFFYDGREFVGRVIGFDRDSDMAVVKIDAEPGTLQPAQLGNSSDLHVGQMTVALGNPFGEDFTMTTGIVSAVGRLIRGGFSDYSIPSVIQTDAAINPGNSGGPLLDINGRVIGMNTQIRSDTRSSSGVGFAVPVDLAKRVVPSLIEDGEHEYSLIGITGIEVHRELRENLGLADNQRGAYITGVQPGTPAEEAGLQGDSGNFNDTGNLEDLNYDGDVIVGVDGQPAESMDDLIAYLALNTSPGDEIVLDVIRDGQQISVVVALGSR